MVRPGMIAVALVMMASAASAQSVPGPPPPAAPGTTALSPGMPPSIYAATTVKDFLALCGNDQGGCADEVGTALNDKMVLDGSANICLPGPDYSGGAITWLKSHPETQSMPTEEGIYLALRKAYACM